VDVARDPLSPHIRSDRIQTTTTKGEMDSQLHQARDAAA